MVNLHTPRACRTDSSVPPSTQSFLVRCGRWIAFVCMQCSCKCQRSCAWEELQLLEKARNKYCGWSLCSVALQRWLTRRARGHHVHACSHMHSQAHAPPTSTPEQHGSVWSTGSSVWCTVPGATDTSAAHTSALLRHYTRSQILRQLAFSSPPSASAGVSSVPSSRICTNWCSQVDPSHACRSCTPCIYMLEAV
jgi:hypothetical protein